MNIVRENLNFERGKDPKDSLGIGNLKESISFEKNLDPKKSMNIGRTHKVFSKHLFSKVSDLLDFILENMDIITNDKWNLNKLPKTKPAKYNDDFRYIEKEFKNDITPWIIKYVTIENTSTLLIRTT